MGQNGPPSTYLESNTSRFHQRVVPVSSANLCTLCCKVQAMCKNTDNAPFLLFVPEHLCHFFACITCLYDTYHRVAMYQNMIPPLHAVRMAFALPCIIYLVMLLMSSGQMITISYQACFTNRKRY